MYFGNQSEILIPKKIQKFVLNNIIKHFKD